MAIYTVQGNNVFPDKREWEWVRVSGAATLGRAPVKRPIIPNMEVCDVGKQQNLLDYGSPYCFCLMKHEG